MESIILLSKNYLNPNEVVKKINNASLTDDSTLFVNKNDDALFIYFDGLVNNEPRDINDTLEAYDGINLPYDKPFMCEIEFYNIDFVKSILKSLNLNDVYVDNNHGLIVSIESFLVKDNPLEEGMDENNTILIL